MNLVNKSWCHVLWFLGRMPLIILTNILLNMPWRVGEVGLFFFVEDEIGQHSMEIFVTLACPPVTNLAEENRYVQRCAPRRARP